MIRKTTTKQQNLSKFQLNNEVKTSFEIGQIIPFMWRDICPADKIRVQSNALIRLMPLVTPVLHRLDFYTRYYFVPYRLLIPNYKEMISNPDSTIKVPSMFDHFTRNKISFDRQILKDDTLLRSFGINSSTGTLSPDSTKKLSQLPFRAYQMIYNYHFMDPILFEDEYNDDMQPDDFKDLDILKIQQATYYNDYFTSSLPNTQYGEAVELDMDNDSVIKVNEMRTAEVLQRIKEKLLMMGNRYLDYLRSFHGTSPHDETLQRPLYLGGDKRPLNITDIDQTANYNADGFATPLGTQAGKSVTVHNGDYIQYSSNEHGILLGLCYILPRQSYITGIDRQFIKISTLDFMNPSFAHLGLQETYGCELDANRTDTFGYNDRYAELKYANDVIAGDFVDINNTWHFGRDIRAEQLGKEFVKAYPTNRPFALEQYTKHDPTQAENNFNAYYIHAERSHPDGFIDSYYYLYMKDNLSDLNHAKDILEMYVDDITGVYSIEPAKLHPYDPANRQTTGRLTHRFALTSEIPPYIIINDANYGVYQEFSKTEVEYIGHTMIEPANYVSLVDGKTTINQELSTFNNPVIGNHCLAVVYNDCSVLRQLPKNYEPRI